MNIIETTTLGIVQGLTEFLPVSSSGHLVILQHIFKDFKQVGISFDVLIHIATLFSVVIYFNKKIREILYSKNIKYIALIVVATIPAGIIGVLFKNQIEAIFTNVKLVSISLIFTGIILFFSDKINYTYKSEKDITVYDAVIIGIFQAISIIPGVSRSGSTITAAIFRKVNRETAIEFSFILSIPAILGALVLSLDDFQKIDSSQILPYFAGFVAAFITGLISLKMLTLIINSKNLKYFAFYCWIIAILTFFIF
jgi:undecaprenyl-diphosphatase